MYYKILVHTRLSFLTKLSSYIIRNLMTICFLSILEFPSVQVAVKLHATFEVSWALRMLRNLPPVALLSTLSLNAVIPAINFVVLLAPCVLQSEFSQRTQSRWKWCRLSKYMERRGSADGVLLFTSSSSGAHS